METNQKADNPLRYEDGATVMHVGHGIGKTFNPRVGSYFVDVDFGDNKIISIHEDELTWAITYGDKCFVFGTKIDSDTKFKWLYSSNKLLNDRSPKAALDDGDLVLVEEVFEKTFP